MTETQLPTRITPDADFGDPAVHAQLALVGVVWNASRGIRVTIAGGVDLNIRFASTKLWTVEAEADRVVSPTKRPYLFRSADQRDAVEFVLNYIYE